MRSNSHVASNPFISKTLQNPQCSRFNPEQIKKCNSRINLRNKKPIHFVDANIRPLNLVSLYYLIFCKL